MAREMSADGYQKKAIEVCKITDDPKEMLAHGVFGLASEAGEVSGIMQKMFQGHDLNEEHLLIECGDALWMICEILTSLGYTLSECMDKNIAKLKKRYPDGFDPARSINRSPEDM